MNNGERNTTDEHRGTNDDAQGNRTNPLHGGEVPLKRLPSHDVPHNPILRNPDGSIPWDVTAPWDLLDDDEGQADEDNMDIEEG